MQMRNLHSLAYLDVCLYEIFLCNWCCDWSIHCRSKFKLQWKMSEIKWGLSKRGFPLNLYPRPNFGSLVISFFSCTKCSFSKYWWPTNKVSRQKGRQWVISLLWIYVVEFYVLYIKGNRVCLLNKRCRLWNVFILFSFSFIIFFGTKLRDILIRMKSYNDGFF